MSINKARLFVLLFLAAGAHSANAGAPIDFVGYKNASAPIFSKAGPTLINYSFTANTPGSTNRGED